MERCNCTESLQFSETGFLKRSEIKMSDKIKDNKINILERICILLMFRKDNQLQLPILWLMYTDSYNRKYRWKMI